MRLELNAERITSGEMAGGWRISAWRGETYLGHAFYLFSTKKFALSKARETIREEGGLGIFRKSLA
jgi:hypothetical protein